MTQLGAAVARYNKLIETSPYKDLGWADELYRGHFLGRVVRLPGGGKCRLGPMKLEAILPWPRLFEVEVRLDLVLEDC